MSIIQKFVELSDSSNENYIRGLLSLNNFNQERYDIPAGVFSFIEEEALKFDFALTQKYITMMYYLGDQDFDEAQLILPNLEGLIRNYDANITLRNIRDVSVGLSNITNIHLLEVYGKDRFALPRFRLYKYGETIDESENVGNEDYSDDFRKKDSDEFLRLFDEGLERLPNLK